MERYDKSPHQPSRKRRQLVSEDPKQARNRSYSSHPQRTGVAVSSAGKCRRLNEASLQRCLRISRDEFFKAWMVNAGRSLRSPTISQLPLPDMTEQSFSLAPTTPSQRSPVSVHDLDYRDTLLKHNVYVPGRDPPAGFREKVESMVFRLRETPELDNEAIEQLRMTMRELQSKGEEEVRSQLGAKIIPGYHKPSDKNLVVVHGQLWNKAVPIPPDSALSVPPFPLPKPKPDTVFGFSKTAFDRYQLGIMSSLVTEPHGPSFASPKQYLLFPYLVIEYKSQAEDGSIRVANNQAADAGAVALNNLRETISRGLGKHTPEVDKIMVFSVAMDQNSASINVKWTRKIPDTNEYTYHFEELRMLTLRYEDSIQVLQRAVKNIHNWAGDHIRKLVVNALNECREMKGQKE